MSDKLRKTQPIKITFSQGEQPTSQKLTALAEQSRNGTAILESAIGDLWNQSGDPWLTTNPLQVPNLARQLGGTAYTNPAIYPGTEEFQFTEKIGDRYAGKTEGFLLFKPKTGVALVTPPPGWSLEVASARLVQATGAYWIDDATGRWRSNDPIGASDTITYVVAPDADWVRGQETLPGIIPDPGQTQFTGCRLSFAGGKYLLHLPPRRPLTLGVMETPANYPSAAEQALAANQATVDGAPFKYWQYGTDAITGITSAHYRYRLPKEILDLYSSLPAGTRLPDGFLYLWDQDLQTIIEGVVFSKPTDPAQSEYVIEVDFSTSNYDPTVIVSGDELEATYSGTPLTLITCGSPLARSVWYLNSVVLQHKHNNTAQEGLVGHKDLLNLNPPSTAYTGNSHNTRYPTYLPAWQPSSWEFDDHTSLLSRAGAQSAGRERDLYNNAMLGHIIMANADPTTGTGVKNYLDGATPNSSFRIYFGDLTGPSIYTDSIADLLIGSNADIQLSSTNLRLSSANLLAFDPAATPTFVSNSDVGLRIRSGQSNGNWTMLQFDGNQNNPLGQIGMLQDVSGSALAFGVSQTYASGITREVMRMKWDGKVGIGDTNPIAGVELVTADSEWGFRQTGSTSSVKIATWVGTTSGWFGTESNHDLDIAANNQSSHIKVKTGGNVGIGIDPAVKFHVGGAGRVDGIFNINQGGDINPSGTPTGQLLIAGNAYTGYTALNATGMYIGHNSASRTLVFQTDETDRMAIAANGARVGIGGAPDATASLLVVGGIRARGGLPGANGVNNNGYAFSGGSGDNDSGLFSDADGVLKLYANNALEVTVDGTNSTFAGNILGQLDAQIAGGLIVGFSGTPTSDTISIGDTNYHLQYSGGSNGLYLQARGISGDMYLQATGLADDWWRFYSNGVMVTQQSHYPSVAAGLRTKFSSGTYTTDFSIQIHSVTTDPNMATSGRGALYCKDVVGVANLFVRNEGNVTTQISPHDPVTGEWYFNHYNPRTGETKKIYMERLVEALEDLLGESFTQYLEGNKVHEGTQAKGRPLQARARGVAPVLGGGGPPGNPPGNP